MVRSRRFALREGAVLALAIQVAFAPRAFAAPGGPVVVNGQVTISQPNAATTQVQSSNGAIINWNQFSVGANQITRFIEPSPTSAVLNRVVGGDASQILGQLQANGRVFLVNPNGIVIGVGARIDTNGFIASTLDIADSDFLAGKLKFTATGNAGAIDNEGLISVGPGGQIALIAPDIQNSGVLFAPGGQLLLAAGRKVAITSSDLADVSVEVQAPSDSVINLGKLLADGGAIQVFAGTLVQEGVIRADGMVADASGSIRLVGSNQVTVAAGSITEANGKVGGSITIQSTSGTAEIAGQVSAQGSAAKGGAIELLGERVGVESGAAVDASGSLGGGEILVGGDLHGANAAVQDANMAYVGQGASLTADATGSGDGGKVVVWSNQNTQYYGALSVRGGAAGGDGGFAEVSGKQNLEFAGAADLTASRGATGSLLLDPLDIIVAANGGILPSVTSQFTVFEGNVVTISPAGLNLVHGNVILEAARNIYFDTPTTFTGTSLTVEAGLATPTGSVILNQNLSTKGGSLELSGYTVSGPGTLSTSGGAVTIAVTGGLGYSAAITTAGGAVTLSSTTGSVNSANVNAQSGHVTLEAPAGSLVDNTLTGGIVTLNSSGSQDNTVNAATRIDATSSGSYVELSDVTNAPLRIGTISGSTGVDLTSTDGMTQVTGGRVTAPSVYISGGNATETIGSASAPLAIASPALQLVALGAPATIALSGNPTLSELSLAGTVAALGGTSITGAANLTSFSLANGGTVLDAVAVASSGFANGLSLQVTNGGISAPTLNIPGPVSISAAGAATLGAITSQSLSVSTTGALSVSSATISNGSISLSSGSCSFFNSSCSSQSPITAGTLSAMGSGSITLTSSDNGTISVGTLNAAGSASLSAGYYDNWNAAPRTGAITIGSATVGGDLDVSNYGTGAITASGALTAASSISLYAGHGAAALQNLTSTNEQVDVTASGSISFQSISATGSGGAVSLSSSGGSISTTVDNAAADIVTSGNVTLTASSATAGAIGDPSFAHPLDIQAGTASTVTLSAGTSVGATGKPVTVDTNGAIIVSSGAGQFDVVAEDSSGVLQSVSTIELTASAAGMGAGGVSSFISHDLSISATSNGSTIAIGNVDQSVNTLNEFSFTASGASSLAFGDVNLTTGGFNQVFLSSGGALTQLQPGTNNVNAGNIGLSGGATGLVILGNVTSSVVAGNAIDISGGNISAMNLTGPSITVAGANLSLGAVNSTGTLSGYYTGYAYVPYLGYSEYVTDELHLAGSGTVATAADITSATSAYVTAGSGITVAGGTGAISGGNNNPPYYTDTVNIASGTGTLAAGAISAFQVSVSGTTLDTRAITAQSGTLTVSATTLATGNLTAPGGNINVSATNFATGNIEAGGSLNLTATGAYVPGAITISSGSSTSMTAPGGIDLTAHGATLEAPSVYLYASGGALSANLIGTTTLGIVAGGTVNLASNMPIASLNIQAKGNLLGAASAITGTGQTFDLSTSGGTTANLSFTSATPLVLDYTELAAAGAVNTINLSSDLATGSSFSLNGSGAVVNAVAVISNGPVSFATTGDINLESVNTEGNSLSASSATGNVSVGSIITGGAQVSLDATLGSILKSGTGPGMIDTGNAGAPSGSVTLTASNGSVGAAGAPLTISNTVSLSVAASNAISLDMNSTTLTNLSIVTGASGTGAISIANNPNFAGFSLTRSGSNLELGTVTPTAAGAFSLVATNGNIVVNGDINVTNLTLDAYDSGTNSTGNLVIAAGTGPRTLTAGNAAYLYAGGDVTIAGGSASGANVSIQAAGLDGYAGHNFIVEGAGGSALVNAPNETINTGGDIEVVGGSSGIAGASGALTASNEQYLEADGNVLVQGGSASGASALAQGSNYQYISSGGNFSVLGGGGSNASATATGGSQYIAVVQGAVTVQGGTSSGAFAAVLASNGYQYLGNQDSPDYHATTSIQVQGGDASGAYALVSSASSQYLQSDGNIEVLGGSGAGAYAQVVSTGGSQNIGSTYGYYSAPTQNILVQAGSGGAASLQANGSQTVEGSGTISVIGGTGSGLTASIVSTGGSQTIGDAQNSFPYYATQNVVVQGGTATGAAALISASTGQTIDAGVAISLTGGAPGASAEITNASGVQNVGNQNSGYQQTQTIALAGGSGAGSSAELTSGGSQNLAALGAITVTNSASDIAEITATGAQSVSAGTLSVSLASPLGGSIAEISAGGAQTIDLNDGSGTATLTIANFSGAGGSLAAVMATGNQTIAMPYTTLAGTIEIGGTTTRGESLLYSGGTQTLVAGEIVVQGGQTAGAAATITSVGDSSMSAINGSVSVLGGSAGPAAIDPPELDLITDGSVTVQAGAGKTATASITAGNINIGATNGSVDITGGATAGANASISANGTPGTLNMYSSGNLVFTPNAATATVSAVATSGNNIFLAGYCTGCADGLIGVFNLSTGAAGPLVAASASSGSSLDDPSMGDLTALLDYLLDLNGYLDLTADGDITLDPSLSNATQCN